MTDDFEARLKARISKGSDFEARLQNRVDRAAPPTLDERAQRDMGLKNYKQRGTILPIGEDEKGRMELAWPQIAVDLAKSFMLPRHAMEGGQYSSADLMKFALDYPTGMTMARAPGAARSGTAKQIIKQAPQTDELFSKAGGLYDKAEATGVTLKPAKYLNTLIELDDAARAAGVDDKLHPRIVSTMAALEKKLDAQQPVDVRGIINIRKYLSSVARDTNPAAADEVRLATILIKRLDDTVDNITPADVASGDAKALGPILSEARKTWQKAKKSQAIEDAIDRASRQASGFENGLRIQFRQLRNNKDAMLGFTAEEKAALDDVIAGGAIQTALRKLGKFSFGGHGNNFIGGSVATGVGAHLGGPVGAILAQVPGTIAGKAAEMATMGRAELARAMAASGKPRPSENVNTRMMRRAAPVVGALIPGEADAVLPEDEIRRRLMELWNRIPPERRA